MASSLNPQNTQAGPPVPQLILTEEEKQFVASQPVLRVSNELNWPPLDFTQTGQPNGYSVDVIKLIAQMTGLKVRFTNGYSWPELLKLFQNGEIDLLQSVILTQNNRNLGLPGSSYVQLPFAVATGQSSSPITDLAQLNTKNWPFQRDGQSFPSCALVIH